ncbi:MAG: hypothetical protein IJY23_01345 [Clostridia bacterium]|nr:hypothetical protein [Clostridia bacterium]
MYSRGCYGEDADIKIPDNYDGTAFMEKDEEKAAQSPKLDSFKSDVKISPPESQKETEEVFLNEPQKEKFRFPKIDFGGILPSFFKKDFSLKSLIPEKIEIEDLLIIGIALFLLFSKNKDIECALMLLALVFIN